MTTAACSASPGSGGLGRHFAELLASLERDGQLSRYYSTGTDAEREAPGEVISPQRANAIARYTPARFSAAKRVLSGSTLFDRSVASRIHRANVHVGFTGQSIRTFETTRMLGCQWLELVSPTSHTDVVARQHQAALRLYPYEDTWFSEALRHRIEQEYAAADVIHVTSEYVWESFREMGVPAEKLRRVALSVAPRFQPAERRLDDGVFRVVYVGALTVAKGVPVLIEAFRKISLPRAELVLVGGYGSRGMRRFIEAARERDRRLRVAPGDPLPYLQAADVLVHPSFDDGFGYGPMEALACGLPVIVTENTGMKEHVREGSNGFIVATGNADEITDRLVNLERSASR